MPRRAQSRIGPCRKSREHSWTTVPKRSTSRPSGSFATLFEGTGQDLFERSPFQGAGADGPQLHSREAGSERANCRGRIGKGGRPRNRRIRRTPGPRRSPCFPVQDRTPLPRALKNKGQLAAAARESGVWQGHGGTEGPAATLRCGRSGPLPHRAWRYRPCLRCPASDRRTAPCPAACSLPVSPGNQPRQERRERYREASPGRSMLRSCSPTAQSKVTSASPAALKPMAGVGFDGNARGRKGHDIAVCSLKWTRRRGLLPGAPGKGVPMIRAPCSEAFCRSSSSSSTAQIPGPASPASLAAGS